MSPRPPNALRPRWTSMTMRARFTVIYSALFAVMGVSLLGILYTLQRNTLDAQGSSIVITGRLPGVPVSDKTKDGRPNGLSKAELLHLAERIHADELHRLLIDSVAAITVLAVVGVGVGWWLGGRTLAPLHRITATARRLSSRNLSERIALDGPADELKALADTFDEMLARLEDAFESQHAFIANVSHELRTPLAIQRVAAQVGLAHPTPDGIERARSELIDANKRCERLIDGLLTLARSDGGLSTREPVELDAQAREAVAMHGRLADEAHVRVSLTTRPTVMSGDPVLLAQLVGNLLHNAIRHNHPGGYAEVTVSPEEGLRVVNTGSEIAAAAVEELFEPFRRLGATRTGSDEGAGLGLSIVRSIARAHGVSVTARPRPGGGLDVAVAIPTVSVVA